MVRKAGKVQGLTKLRHTAHGLQAGIQAPENVTQYMCNTHTWGGHSQRCYLVWPSLGKVLGCRLLDTEQRFE